MWFMSDPAHWVKKVVTHWEKSKRDGKPGARYLRIPDHLVQPVLKRCAPPAPHVHQSLERGGTVGIEWYCRVLGRCYAIMGGAHQPRFHRLDDPRLQELRDILALVRAWHAYNAARPNLAAGQKSARGFSHQLLWDTQIMIEGFLGLLSDLQVRHGSFIVRVRMLNQDSLESMFGRIRMACGSGNDPTMLKVLQAATRAEEVAIARADIRNRRIEQSTNSGQAGAVGLPQPGAWIDRHRIVLEHRSSARPKGWTRSWRTARSRPRATRRAKLLWHHLITRCCGRRCVRCRCATRSGNVHSGESSCTGSRPRSTSTALASRACASGSQSPCCVARRTRP